MTPINIPAAGMISPSITDFLQSSTVAMRSVNKNGEEFADVLSKTINPSGVDVRFSGKAKSSVANQGIKLSQNDIKQLDKALDIAKKKARMNRLCCSMTKRLS